MGKPTRVLSRKTGKTGWKFRFTDPVTGRRAKKTFWQGDERKATRAYLNHMEGREQIALGLPDPGNWKISFQDLTTRFLKEAGLTAQRVTRLKTILDRNELELVTAGDLVDVGRLQEKCQQITPKLGAGYMRDSVQKVLKQLTKWAASSSVRALPSDPLASWKLLPAPDQEKVRRSFLPDEVQAILAAADEYDALSMPLGRRWANRNEPAAPRHKYPSRVPFEVFLMTMNRPGAQIAANCSQLGADRIKLPKGKGKKRNGAATLPNRYMAEVLRPYCAGRSPDEPLLVSHDGQRIDRNNLSRYFERCEYLAFTRMEWPHDDVIAASIEPAEIAYRLYHGRQKGYDGPKPKDEKLIKARITHTQQVEDLAEWIRPKVEARLAGRDMYTLRKTARSWVEDLNVNANCVRIQMGRAASNIDEAHYIDRMDPHKASDAIYGVLTGELTLSYQKLQPEPLRKAAGAEGEETVVPIVAPTTFEPQSSARQPRAGTRATIKATAVYKNVPGGIRTSDLSLRRMSEPQQQAATGDHSARQFIGARPDGRRLQTTGDNSNSRGGGTQFGTRSRKLVNLWGELQRAQRELDTHWIQFEK